MSGKLFVLIAFICAVQAFEAGEISIETRQKLRQAIVDSQNAKRASEHEVNAVTDPIEKRADAALDPIKKNIKLLELKVQIAKKKAELSNVDITECVDAERTDVHKVDRDDVRNCKQIVETKLAHKKIGEIGDEIHSLHEAPQTCVGKPDADKCVLKAIAAAQKKIKLHQKEITAALKHVKPAKQNKCVDDNAAKLQKQVNEIKENWEACLKKKGLTDN